MADNSLDSLETFLRRVTALVVKLDARDDQILALLAQMEHFNHRLSHLTWGIGIGLSLIMAVLLLALTWLWQLMPRVH